MARAKNERNEQFIRAWKEEGSTDRELQERFGLSEGGVKGLKARLRQKDPSLYAEPHKKLTRIVKKQQVNKSLSPQVDKVISPLVHKRATYYLTSEIVRKIKQIALNREIDSSGLVREILSEWISEQVDK